MAGRRSSRAAARKRSGIGSTRGRGAAEKAAPLNEGDARKLHDAAAARLSPVRGVSPLGSTRGRWHADMATAADDARTTQRARGMSMSDFEASDYAISRGYFSLGTWDCWPSGGGQRASLYRHPRGIVEIYEYRGGCTPITSMKFIWTGRHYRRCWEHAWGDNTLARLAREFVEEVTA